VGKIVFGMMQSLDGYVAGTFQEGWYQQFRSGSVDQAALSRSGLLIQTSLGSSTRLGSPLMNRSGVDA
jgi:hypothetical protein